MGFQYKLTQKQKYTLQLCEKIKAGDTQLQRWAESQHGLRQFTRDEIDVVNKLLKGENGPSIPFQNGEWLHIPKNRHDHIDLYPATIIKLHHVWFTYYLVYANIDETGEMVKWITRKYSGGYEALFDASEWVKNGRG